MLEFGEVVRVKEENFHCYNQMKILIKSYDLCIIIVQEGM